MKSLAAAMTVLLMFLFAFRYAYQVRKGKISPVLSMWVVFFAGAFIGLISYASAESRDFLTGIQNVVDLGAITVIIISILLWGKTKKAYFQRFEKRYLFFAAVIILFWVIWKSAFYSNILTQILMTWAYFPTIQNLIAKKKNTESFSSWMLVFFAQLCALAPAFIEGNLLAALYVVRAEVMTIVLLVIMTCYHFKNGQNKRANLI